LTRYTCIHADASPSGLACSSPGINSVLVKDRAFIRMAAYSFGA